MSETVWPTRASSSVLWNSAVFNRSKDFILEILSNRLCWRGSPLNMEIMKNHRWPIVSMSLVLLLTAAQPSLAQTYDHGPIFSLVEENDLIVNTDRHYTQGIKVSYLHEDGYLPLCAKTLYEHLPTIGFEPKTGKFGYEVGQNIYTPGNILVTNLLANDRPYAGWLYGGLILQRRGECFGPHSTLESFQLDIGVVGSWSLAKEAQTWVHEMRGFNKPRGWDNQLHNEPGIELKYQRSIRFRGMALHPLDVDFIPHAGFSAGTIEDTARAGALLRLGFNLPDDYGIQTIDSLTTSSGGYSDSQPTARWGAYVFAGSEGKAVAWNTFLDGNVFHQSHHVHKEHLVADFKAGFALVLNRVEVGFTYVLRTLEFHGQDKEDRFGSAFLKVKF
jgi:hypothetical protein